MHNISNVSLNVLNVWLYKFMKIVLLLQIFLASYTSSVSIIVTIDYQYEDGITWLANNMWFSLFIIIVVKKIQDLFI